MHANTRYINSTRGTYIEDVLLVEFMYHVFTQRYIHWECASGGVYVPCIYTEVHPLRMYFWWSLCTLYLHRGTSTENVLLVEFMYLVFTCMPGESYCRQLRSLLLYLCYVFQSLINSLVRWFCTSAVGLVLFPIYTYIVWKIRINPCCSRIHIDKTSWKFMEDENKAPTSINERGFLFLLCKESCKWFTRHQLVSMNKDFFFFFVKSPVSGLQGTN